MKTVRVLLVDDHAILRMGLASLLSSKADIEVVGDAPNGPAGIRKALRLKPDVVKEHVESIFQKIGAANRTEAVAIAFRKHLLKL